VKLKLTLSVLLLCFTAAAQQDTWKPAELTAPAKIAEELKTPDPARHIFYVGFPILYKGAHIKDAALSGPCSKKEGLDLLTASLKNVPHDAEVIIYCGCCPFIRCPNIRPAYQALKDLGYTNIKVLELPTNLHTDWVEKGYPIESAGK
jgi:hypothetical protein